MSGPWDSPWDGTHITTAGRSREPCAETTPQDGHMRTMRRERQTETRAHPSFALFGARGTALGGGAAAGPVAHGGRGRGAPPRAGTGARSALSAYNHLLSPIAPHSLAQLILNINNNTIISQSGIGNG